MQQLRNLNFELTPQANGRALLTAQLSSTLLGVKGEISASEIELLIAYLMAVKIKMTKMEAEKKESKL